MESFFEPEEYQYRYIIGIDLGTTNSAVAYIDLAQQTDQAGLDQTERAIRLFDIPQFVAQGELGSLSILPSFLYLPGPYDLPEGSTALPWNPEREHIVGEFAREQGTRVPGRLVLSAKSWLCHAGVDRTSPILPWGSGEDVDKVSPVEASMCYLQHVRESWDVEMAMTSAQDEKDTAEQDEEEQSREAYRFADQLIILTVPASFDEVARELTLKAAHEAGIPRVILLEEPLAAFYAWLSKHENEWQNRMRAGQLILVCDVGGGTTDFSIVGISESAAGLRFDRLAVGDHLMLGGDNMDLTLGRHQEVALMGRPGKLETQRWQQLVAQCRSAKESLIDAPPDAPAVDITLTGTGRSLIADTRKGMLTREDVRGLILDGFFPAVALDELPDETRRSGLAELGLPYTQDAAITRHLAAFWQRFTDFLCQETGREAVYPDYLLYNGGTLIPSTIRRRMQSVIQQWFQPVAGETWQPIELKNPDPKLAVGLGAAYYGLVRLGKGVRVGSGSPRAYYVGVESGEGQSEETHSAVCLVPRGTEEGFEVRLNELNFEALTNQPVAFEVFTSSTRLGDQLGDVVQLQPDEVSTLPPIRTVLRYGRKGIDRLPVQLAVRLTEVGTLEVWCQSRQTEHRWQLQFDVRQADEPDADSLPAHSETIDHGAIEMAQAEIGLTFPAQPSDNMHPPEQLRKRLEEQLAMSKEVWSTMLIRKLADSLLESEAGRARSAAHEARWLNMSGYCLRPGFGHPVDEWRLKQVWKVYIQGLRYPQQVQVRSEWWIFWRRVAGGLKAGQQMQIYDQVQSYLQSESAGKGSKKSSKNKKLPKNLGKAERLEIWMMLANFEWLTPKIKAKLGRRLLAQFRKTPPKPHELWALSRFGARNTIYGPLDRLISSEEAADWAQKLLALGLEPTDSMAHSLVLLTRQTGDRARDVPEELRASVAAWFAPLSNAKKFNELLLNPESAMASEEQAWMFGEALPAGLLLETV